MNKIIIGIDPGKSGAICAIRGKEILLLEKCPTLKNGTKQDYDVQEMCKIMSKLQVMSPIAYVERVHAMPKQGVCSMFDFGMGYGIWLGLLHAMKIPFVTVPPQSWKKVLLEGTDKSKTAAIQRVQRYFPNVDLKPGKKRVEDHNLAEALLIAMYGGIQEIDCFKRDIYE